MASLFFSIIVPIYKVEQYLNQCVESVLGQTFKDFELILVDDGSPDGCPKMCDDYAAKYERVKVVHKENGGLSSARNAGIRVANGDIENKLKEAECFTNLLEKGLWGICLNRIYSKAVKV